MPRIPYPGGKARTAKQIISLLPRKGRLYLEPFAGRGNLFFAAVEQGLRYEKWWLNDIATASFFEAILTHGHTIEVPPRSRQEFERQRDAYKKGDATAALLAPYLSFSGGLFDGGCKGGSGCRDDGGGVTSKGFQNALRECHQILKRTRPKITALDWAKLGLEGLSEDDVVVLDPPYPGARTKTYSDSTLNYNDLVDVLLNAKFRWVLCGYPHPLLHRLGAPVWGRDVDLLCVRMKSGNEERNECVWANFTPETENSGRALPSSVKGQIRSISNAASLSFNALDAKIDNGLDVVANDFSALLPYLLEMHRRLSAPGQRTDLRKGAPVGLTWTAWVETKRHKLGRSLRTIQYMLQGKTNASQQRQALIEARARLHSEPISLIPETPMEIATEMARLVLDMRSNGRNTPENKKKLERLAVQFLRVVEQDSVSEFEHPDKEPGYTM